MTVPSLKASKQKHLHPQPRNQLHLWAPATVPSRTLTLPFPCLGATVAPIPQVQVPRPGVKAHHSLEPPSLLALPACPCLSRPPSWTPLQVSPPPCWDSCCFPPEKRGHWEQHRHPLPDVLPDTPEPHTWPHSSASTFFLLQEASLPSFRTHCSAR